MKSKVAIISALLITTFGFSSVAEASDSLVEVINQQDRQENLIAGRGRSRSRSPQGESSTRGRERSTQERGTSSRGTNYKLNKHITNKILRDHGHQTTEDKSRFPSTWDKKKITDAVTTIANDISIPLETSNRNNTRTGTFDGVEMIVVMKSNGTIISGYPLEDHDY